MTHLNVVLRKIAIEISITLKSIPLRLRKSASNCFTMMQSGMRGIVHWVSRPKTESRILLIESCGLPHLTIHESFTKNLTIAAEVGCAPLKKKAYPGEIITHLGCSSPDSQLVRYATLSEMDTTGSMSNTLAKFDNVTLDDLCYVTAAS